MQRELKLLNTISAMFVFASGLLGPIYAVFVQNIGGDLMTAGWAYGAFSIASGVLVIFLSRWEERHAHQERIMAAGFGLGCLGFLGYSFVSTPLHLLIVQVVLGVALAIRAPLFDSFYSLHLDLGKYAEEWGVWESMNLIVIGISAAVGGVIAQLFGFPVLFVAMFIVSLAGFIVSLSFVFGPRR
jgi:uncharacterized membrane protein